MQAETDIETDRFWAERKSSSCSLPRRHVQISSFNSPLGLYFELFFIIQFSIIYHGLLLVCFPWSHISMNVLSNEFPPVQSPSFVLLLLFHCSIIYCSFLCTISPITSSFVFCFVQLNFFSIMGGDLGENGGQSPKKIWGGGTVHASIPPIFREVVLLDALQSTNWLK